MSNRFLGTGDERKFHLLAGFETVDDEGQGGIGASGTGSIPLVEAVRAAVVSALVVTRGEGSLDGLIIRDPSDPNNPGEGQAN